MLEIIHTLLFSAWLCHPILCMKEVAIKSRPQACYSVSHDLWKLFWGIFVLAHHRNLVTWVFISRPKLQWISVLMCVWWLTWSLAIMCYFCYGLCVTSDKTLVGNHCHGNHCHGNRIFFFYSMLRVMRSLEAHQLVNKVRDVRFCFMRLPLTDWLGLSFYMYSTWPLHMYT